MTFSFDKRRSDRYNLTASIEYVLDPYNPEEIFKGSIINISDKGICFLTATPLKESQEIIIKNILPIPSQTATILWVEKCDDYYKAGIVLS